MKAKRKSHYFFILILVIVEISICFNCKKNTVSDKNYFEYVESITRTSIKRLDSLSIILKDEIIYPEHLDKACALTPKTKGTWSLSGQKQIIFTPEEPYDYKKTLVCSLDIGLLQTGQANKKNIAVSFKVTAPDFTIVSAELIPDEQNSETVNLEAEGVTDIHYELSSIEKMLSAVLMSKGKKSYLKPVIQYAPVEAKYKISIKDIIRNNDEQKLILSWDLKAIGGEGHYEKNFTISPESIFQPTLFLQTGESEITVNFSDSLDETQDLRGFIKVESKYGVDFRYTIDGYKLKLFFQHGACPADAKITLLKGIKNRKGKSLENDFVYSIMQKWDSPEVYFTNKGNILPVGNLNQKAEIFISTKNISGIVLEAHHIHINNMLQFLQMNTFETDYQLRRVSTPVWKEEIPLEWDISMKNNFVTHALDITKVMQKFQGGIIRLKISFSKKHSMYQPELNDKDFSHLPFPKSITDIEDEQDVEEYYWANNDIPQEEYYQFWNNRNNPSHPAYYLASYNDRCSAEKNVLLSNIGLSVKKDAEDKLYIAAADLQSCEPLNNVNITLFNYGQKKLEEGKTDASGLIMFENKNKAAFVQAEKNGMFNWLMLGDDKLSTSHFEVEGKTSQKGVKGCLYAERGVWRPGDDIHLVFILQDTENKLPKDFPIRFVLEDPFGRKTDTKVLTSSVDGFYRIDAKTNVTDKTGTWVASVIVGGKTWKKYLKIESIIPNRLFVNLNSSEKYLSETQNKVNLEGEWLHGSPASGLKADISARFILNKNPFPEYKNYIFADADSKVVSTQNKLWEGNLDNNGKAVINLNLTNKEKYPGKLKAIFETKIYETGGLFSVENKTLDFSPYERYVGIRIPKSDDSYRDVLYTNHEQTFDFLLLNPDGNVIKGSNELTVNLYKLEWLWWWETDYENINYATAQNTKLVKTWDITAVNGKSNLKFKIDENDWGRYLISVSDKNGLHSASQIIYFDWESWSSRSGTKDESSSMMLLTTNKPKYFAGETAEISFPSYKGAKTLVTVEKNGKILQQEWIQSLGNICTYKIKLQPDMAPNVYIHTSLIQEHKQTKNSLPIRMYGIVPVMVENKESHLTPVIKVEETVEANGKISIGVSEENGKPMTYTVAVVDEGLLGLTDFHTENPWNEFYRKEASQISSWDIYPYVLGAYTGKIESLLSVGGGTFIERKGGKNAERFKPVVFFFGPYELKNNEKKQIEFNLPQYAGALRIAVVAGKKGSYGVCEKTVKVKSDLIAVSSLPRTIGAGEKLNIPVTIFNGTQNTREVNVSLTAEGASIFSEQKKITVAANSDATVLFNVKFEKPGIAKFYTEAKSGNLKKSATAFTEIQIISRGTPYHSNEIISIPAGQNVTKTVKVKGEPDTKKISVEVSQLPALGLEQRIQQLLEQPYGNLEYVISKAFAQLYLSSIEALEDSKIEKIKFQVNDTLQILQNYQLRSGGFSNWPSSGGNENGWLTNYAGHFMIEAKKFGYPINDSVYNLWLNNQMEKAKTWASSYLDNIEVQAYRLYTLAIAGSQNIGAMNRMNNMKGSLNDASLALLANSYAITGHKKTAEILLQEIQASHFTKSKHGKNFETPVRNSALLLTAYTICENTEKCIPLIEKLAAICSSGNWLSSHDMTWLLLSLEPHYRFDKTNNIEFEIQTEENTTKDFLTQNSKTYDIPVKENSQQTIEIRNTGKSPLYTAIYTGGILKPGSETSFSSGLKLNVGYTSENGNPINNISELKKSERFIINATVTNTSNLDLYDIVLSIPIPTGWEISNPRLYKLEEDEGGISAHALLNYDYQDIQDTHIYTYFNLEKKETKNFEFRGTITHTGNYFVPAITVNTMYDNEYKAQISGQFINN